MGASMSTNKSLDAHPSAWRSFVILLSFDPRDGAKERCERWILTSRTDLSILDIPLLCLELLAQSVQLNLHALQLALSLLDLGLLLLHQRGLL